MKHKEQKKTVYHFFGINNTIAKIKYSVRRVGSLAYS